MRRFVRLLAVVVVLVGLGFALPGCERDDPAPPIVVVTPEPVRGIIAQTQFDRFESSIWVSIEILVANRGKLDITVDWTYPDTWMYVYFGDTACDYAQLSGATCPFLIESETKDPKPRLLFTDFVDPGSYYVVLYNVPWDRGAGTGSDNTEAVSIQLGLTVGFLETQDEPSPVRLGRPIVVAPPHP